jgi:hypothetical protein
LIIGSATCLDAHLPFPGWFATVPTTGTMLVINAGPNAWANRRVLNSRSLRAIGVISYPIYLWHWPLLVFARGVADSEIVRFGAVALSLLLARLTYRYVEVPIRFGRFSAKPNTPTVISAILAGLVMTCGLGQLAPAWQRYALKMPAWATTDYHTEAVMAYRQGRCFLRPTQTAAEFARDCAGEEGPAANGSAPLMLLWGDSFAAHLYPGLLARQRPTARNFRLAQFTASSCPPIFGISVDFQRNCNEVNDTTKRMIGRLKPQTVIIAAHWSWYLRMRARGSHFSPDLVTATVRHLRALGAAHVIVVGPVPIWNMPLPQALLLETRQNTVTLPKQMREHLRSEAFDLETEIKTAVVAGGGRYISATEALCDPRFGCLTSVATAQGMQPVAWDNDHFTVAGSMTFIDRIWDQQIAPDLLMRNSGGE